MPCSAVQGKIGVRLGSDWGRDWAHIGPISESHLHDPRHALGVTWRVEQHTLAVRTITPRTPSLLVVSLNTLAITRSDGEGVDFVLG